MSHRLHGLYCYELLFIGRKLIIVDKLWISSENLKWLGVVFKGIYLKI